MTHGPVVPPANFAKRTLPTVTLPTRTVLIRIHNASKTPIWFGPAPGDPPLSRFDDPNGEYRVCYIGKSLEAAFVEVFLRDVAARLLSRDALEERAASNLVATRDITLIKFHGNGLHRLGATAAVAHGSYTVSQPWGRACWEHPSQPDGIVYRARHDDDELAIALFDRAQDAVDVQDPPVLMIDLEELPDLLDHYGIGL